MSTRSTAGEVRKRKVTTTREPATPVSPSWSQTQHNTAGRGIGARRRVLMEGGGEEMWLTTEEFYTLLPEVTDNDSGQIVLVFKFLTELNKEY